ncbi:MAG: hypothetical protein NTX50_26250 [Candidatus Sumerlaeota bacterium]|nr:hypothetical protein [Candidatus Sumerlaeota bacterium]
MPDIPKIPSLPLSLFLAFAIVMLIPAASAQWTSVPLGLEAASTYPITHSHNPNRSLLPISVKDIPATFTETLRCFAPDYVIAESAGLKIQSYQLCLLKLACGGQIGEAYLQCRDGQISGEITMPLRIQDVPTTRVMILYDQRISSGIPGEHRLRWQDVPEYAASLYWFKTVVIESATVHWAAYWHSSQPLGYSLGMGRVFIRCSEVIGPNELPEGVCAAVAAKYPDYRICWITRKVMCNWGKYEKGRLHHILLDGFFDSIILVESPYRGITELSRESKRDKNIGPAPAPGKAATGAPPAGF